jgi:hypothetical protein
MVLGRVRKQHFARFQNVRGSKERIRLLKRYFSSQEGGFTIFLVDYNWLDVKHVGTILLTAEVS